MNWPHIQVTGDNHGHPGINSGCLWHVVSGAKQQGGGGHQNLWPHPLHGLAKPMKDKIKIHLHSNRRGYFSRQVLRHLSLQWADLSPFLSAPFSAPQVFIKRLLHTFSAAQTHAGIFSLLLYNSASPWPEDCNTWSGKQMSELVLWQSLSLALLVSTSNSANSFNAVGFA